jgi:hypothetical protein
MPVDARYVLLLRAYGIMHAEHYMRISVRVCMYPR